MSETLQATDDVEASSPAEAEAEPQSQSKTEDLLVQEGDIAGDYGSWTPTPGQHTLTAVPYLSNSAVGETGRPLTITFTVTNP